MNLFTGLKGEGLRMNHDLYHPMDKDIPESLVRDIREGGLSVCRTCCAAENQLSQACREPVFRMGQHNELGFIAFDVHHWANELFPKRTTNDVLIKFFEEIGEYVKSPKNAGEWADLAILLLDLAVRNDINPTKAIEDKMRINRSRSWAVNPETKIMQHTEPGNMAWDHGTR